MSTTPLVINDASVNVALKYVDFLEKKLNIDLGFYYWKKYIAAAFWSQVSMPISLVITLLTAITTAQATAPNLLPDTVYRNISITTLVITVLNTFFRPHAQMTQSLEAMQRWNALGIEFEKIYYSDINNVETAVVNSEKTRDAYLQLQEKINTLRAAEGPTTTNFLTDLIHIISIHTCLRKSQKWLDFEKQVEKEHEDTICLPLS
jgi:hypothetical protein